MNLRLLVISLLLISGFYSAQVGVNTTTPTETLDVNGSLRVRNINQIGPNQSAKDSIMVFDADGVVKYVSANKVVSQATAGSSKVLTNSTLTGNGSTGNELGLAQQGATSGQVLAWNGTTWLPVNAAGLSTTVSNTSTANLLSTTVNGTTGTTVNIINNNALSITSGILKSSVNGVDSTATLPVSDGSDTKVEAGTGAVTVTGTGTTANPYKVNNTFTEVDGSITNEVNTALSSAVNTLSITDSNGTLTAPMVNSVANDITAGKLTTTVNGVAGTAITLPVSDGSDTKVTAAGINAISGNGTTATPYIITGTEVDGSVTNEVNTALSSAVNTLSITDSNGTLTAPMVNSVANDITAGKLTTTVNGVAGTPITLPVSDGSDTKVEAGTGAVTVIGTGTTANPYKVNNTFTEVDGSITNEVNTALSSAVNTLSITDSNGTLTAPMVNSNNLTITSGVLKSSVNGVESTVTLPVSDGSDTKVTAAGINSISGNGTTATPYIITGTEVDGSITNELQTLSITGNTISLSNTGGSVTIPTATTSQDGIISFTDWNTFNNKIGAVTATTRAAVTTSGTTSTVNNTGAYWNANQLQGIAISSTAPTSNQVLSYNGTNWTPTTQAATVASFSGGTTGLTPDTATTGAVTLGGTLAIANGGTGISTAATPGSIVFGNTATTLGYTAAGTAGQILKSNGAGAPTWVNATVPISSITPAIATNTIDNTNFAQTWNWSTATTQNPLALSGNALTTGNLLSLSGTGTLTSGSLINATAQVVATTTKGLLNIQNTAGASTGTVATIQANSTAGSGVNVYANGNVGVNTTTPAFTVATNTTATAPTLGVDGTTNSTNYTSTYLNLGNSGASFTWNQNAGSTASVTLTANSTLIITNAKMGMYGLIIVKQDATGNRKLTLPAGSKVINGGAGVLELTAVGNAADMLSYFYDGANYWWTVGYNYN
ncbi:beta strand repeat-containing protein [Frigoriflavimonas asaccharolytica]|uniref:Uncharacterized protein n=1 Tax=Frigoriflavimonas asaccharolytica TaxID=2735899 RepID=A0A8J8K6C4_9FLAO|nr:hypothetical protein [Frigoriflavimonas asaccharolytica]NRS93585.1 hypothetical protein [Frigoriflavimonas asaccharolytica]